MSWSPPLLWLSYGLVAELVTVAAEHAPNETGGLLLGYWANEDEAVGTLLIGPGPNARHLPTGFAPDTEYQERRLANEYARSGRRLEYLGDWHTHPSSDPTPSEKDEGTLKRIAIDPDARCPRPLMVIVGDPDEWVVGVWCLRRRWRLWSVAAPVRARLFGKPTQSDRAASSTTTATLDCRDP
jgi:integrative and conjugative element protein (TIGR02256 family)